MHVSDAAGPAQRFLQAIVEDVALVLQRLERYLAAELLVPQVHRLREQADHLPREMHGPAPRDVVQAAGAAQHVGHTRLMDGLRETIVGRTEWRNRIRSHTEENWARRLCILVLSATLDARRL